jgi:hypothetical protein
MHPKMQRKEWNRMIDLEKWEQATEEQKIQTCVSLAEIANEKAISKDDYILMFRFLLKKVQDD